MSVKTMIQNAMKKSQEVAIKGMFSKLIGPLSELCVNANCTVVSINIETGVVTAGDFISGKVKIEKTVEDFKNMNVEIDGKKFGIPNAGKIGVDFGLLKRFISSVMLVVSEDKFTLYVDSKEASLGRQIIEKNRK